MCGTVKWYNRLQGFGLIEVEERTIFVHESAIQSNRRHLEHGQAVEFAVDIDAKGRDFAINVIDLKADRLEASLASTLDAALYTDRKRRPTETV